MKTESTSAETETSRPTAAAPNAPPMWKVVAAFAAIYLIWGSTYLAIRYGVASIPPFLMAGSRFFTAGVLLYGFARIRGGGRPSLLEWRNAAIVGGLLLMVGNGGVTWAEQFIPSGVTALLVALVPMWMVLVDCLRGSRERPGPLVICGWALGFAGVAVLTRNNTHGAVRGYGWGVAAVMAASICWAIGSIFSRHARKPASPLLNIGMQMIAGGALLLLAGLLHGETAAFSFRQITAASAGAWLYLTTIGSLVGYTAYAWLLQVSTPARVSTYAYVNPLIAVALGCGIGHEPPSSGLFVAGGLIVAAVVLIVRSARAPAARAQASPVKTPATSAP